MTRVLVVDDEPAIRGLLCDALSGEGYEVREAGSGPEAVETAEAAPPDLAFVDLNLPGMDGEGVARHLRRRWGDHVAVVLVSASPRLPLAAQAVGACAYLAKPFDLDLLLALTDGLVPA